MNIEDYFRIHGKYELVDGLYNVKGDVHLIKRVEKLPVKFGNVSGNFICYGNNLKSLEGAPKSTGGNFYCYYNLLKSLEGSPTSIGGDFWCNNNKLTSLKGCPTYVGGHFYCDDNLKRTIEYRQYLIMRKLRS